jgi:erythronate-4-phosphate dehydrogenase
MKVVIDKDIPYLKGVLEQHAAVVSLSGSAIARSDVLDADALIVRTRTTCNAGLLEGTNAAGCNSSSVQQYVGAALFHLSSKMDFELARKTIGIVGVGNVGSKVARLCSTLGMRVLLNDPPRERREGKGSFVSIERIIRESDIITVHVPLNKEGVDRTAHLIDRGLLSRMKRDQILINTSRGEVADTTALISALKGGNVGAVVLDVWEDEPAIDLELLRLVNLGTPHIAGYSADGKANGTCMSIRALSRFFKLGIDNWFPENVPAPQNPVLELDCAGLKRQKVFCKLVSRTYDILADDQRLRNSPASFEHQRAAYPIRREFPAYTVKLSNAASDVVATVRQLGFNLNEQ